MIIIFNKLIIFHLRLKRKTGTFDIGVNVNFLIILCTSLRQSETRAKRGAYLSAFSQTLLSQTEPIKI